MGPTPAPNSVPRRPPAMPVPAANAPRQRAHTVWEAFAVAKQDDTLRISRPSAHLGHCSVPEGRAATKFRGIAGPASNWATAMFDGFGATRVDPPALPAP